ncbi:hypothetical protein ACFVHB_29995 [Kitasatospora sp. NPDC127111]|uniref:hypothetical protein n=1 Tax=Kitasatospora sp. NPDC127111 TaxID=3345363 RepID=UPI003636AA0C
MAADGPGPREVIAALVGEGAEILPGPPALEVPEASADTVIAAARRLALRALPRERRRQDRSGLPALTPDPDPDPGLRRVAAVLFVDEHPSAPAWSAADRDRLAAWVAVLIEQRGEDGVQDLIAVLGGRPTEG